MPGYEERVHALIKSALEEDLGEGDHSTLAAIPADARGKAELKIKQDGILAGVAVSEKIVHFKEPRAHLQAFKQDGDAVRAGEIAFELEATVHCILQTERVILNCMQRMSGIASLTRQFVDQVRGYGSIILDTRKTTPNFRLLEKEAVRIGGGQNHRFGLDDMIMLKDNHIDFCGGIQQAIEQAFHYVQKYKPGLKIEIETRNLQDVQRVLEVGRVDRIMLDNFSVPQLQEALEMIQGRFETEASGGINLANVREYAATGVDFLSIGALIHQARSIDLSLKAVCLP